MSLIRPRAKPSGLRGTGFLFLMSQEQELRTTVFSRSSCHLTFLQKVLQILLFKQFMKSVVQDCVMYRYFN